MRKAIIVLIFLLLVPIELVQAQLYYFYYYQSYRDEYRVDHTTPAGTEYIQLYFINPTDQQVYDKILDEWSDIIYLTCNGSYWIRFFDANDNLIEETDEIITTQIVNPLCDSYPEMTGKKDLSAEYFDNGDGTYTIIWDDIGAEKYEIYVDGQLVDTTTDTEYELDGPGSVTIVARDSNDDIIGEDDMNVPSMEEQHGDDEDEGCNVCKKLEELLQCPHWDEYMSEFERTIEKAMGDFFGSVPQPPSIEDVSANIEQPEPDLDIEFDGDDLMPDMPQEIKDGMEYDLSDAEVIPIVDESEPFIIYDPLYNFEYDQPGVPVFPDDERNQAIGIPEDYSGTIPIPEVKEPSEPSDPIPIPEDKTENGESGAQPDYYGGTVPIPNNSGKGGDDE